MLMIHVPYPCAYATSRPTPALPFYMLPDMFTTRHIPTKRLFLRPVFDVDEMMIEVDTNMPFQREQMIAIWRCSPRLALSSGRC